MKEGEGRELKRISGDGLRGNGCWSMMGSRILDRLADTQGSTYLRTQNSPLLPTQAALSYGF